MPTDSSAFERYRRSPNEKTTLSRLVLGAIVIAACWFGFTMIVIFGGAYVFFLSPSDGGPGATDPVQELLSSPGGIFATLATFAGIWIGTWIVMRVLHKERLSKLYGNAGRVSRSGFFKGFAAVAATSLLTEAGYLAMLPQVERGPIDISVWALLLLPLAAFAFIQTSAEELLFRGYLPRGLAHRFRSPLVWAVMPTALFTALHWNPSAAIGMNLAVMIAIGAFSALLMLLVHATGNLGAAMGAHLGNNLFGFAVISHEDALGGLALFRGASLESLAWTPLTTTYIGGLSVVSILLTWLLLLHPRSPLKVGAEAAAAPEPAGKPALP